MRKKLFIISIFCSILILTGCGSSSNGGKDNKDNYNVYEYHTYDNDFRHTEELEARYDKSTGKLKFLAMWLVWTDRTSCEGFNYTKENTIDLTYPGVTGECTITDKGVKAYWSMTDESLEKGYLKDNEDWDFQLKYVYPDFETEEKAKAYLEDGIKYLKEQNIKPDEENYIIIKNEKVTW